MVSAIVAGLCIPLSVVSVWSLRTVKSESGYTAALDPLASKPAIVDALASTALKAIYADLPPSAPITQADADTKEVSLVLLQAFSSPEFRVAWANAVARSHPTARAVLTGSDSPGVDTAHGLTVDVTPFLTEIFYVLDAHGIHDFDIDRTTSLTAHPVTIELLTEGQLREVRSVFGVVTDLGWALPVIAAVALVVALVLARSRLLVAASIAAGAAGVGGLCLLALTGSEDLGVHRATAAGVSAAVTSDFVHTLFSGLSTALLIAVGASAAVAVLCFVADFIRPVGRHRHSNRSQ